MIRRRSTWTATDSGRRCLMVLMAIVMLVPAMLVHPPQPVVATLHPVRRGNLSAARMLPVTEAVLHAAAAAKVVAAASARRGSAAAHPPLQTAPATKGALPIAHYTVQAGDTLSGIAARFGSDVASLAASNHLDAASLIQPGQHLIVPTAVGWVYRVGPEDTLGQIAAQAGLSASAIAAANHIGVNSVLQVGQRLWIPHDPPASVPPSRATPQSSPSQGSGQVVATGKMPWPVHGPITSPFGWRILFGERNFHFGIDIGVPMYTPVHASMTGRVVTAGWFGPYGIAIRIENGDLMTLYAHNSRALVHVGQYVHVGQLISYSGMTGNATGPHVHFGVYINGRAVNPMGYLQP